ncbi:MAG: DUF721 domain-containing protein [Akkermansia sp.]
MPPRRKRAETEAPLTPAALAERRPSAAALDVSRRRPQRMADGSLRVERWRSRARGERDQAEADFYGAGPELPTGCHLRDMRSLLGEVLAALPLEEESFSAEILAEAWERAAGIALAQMTALLSVERGMARIRAAHPAARYELTRLKPRIIVALNRILGEGCVERVRIVSR